MKPEDIERVLREVLSEEEENESDISELDTEEEVIEEENHDSESEQSVENFHAEIRDEEERQDSDDYKFYIGKDGETIWMSKPPASSSKTKAKNIIKILPGPKMAAKNTRREIDAFHCLLLMK